MDALHRLHKRAADCSLQATDKNIGSSQSSSVSVSTFVSTLVPVAVFAGVWFVLFILLRTRFPRQYSPRSFLGALRPEQRSPELPKGYFAWIPAFYNIPDSYVLNHHSLDAFLFLRFLKVAVVSCLVGCVITWPILFPINATGGGGKTQFDAITIANVTNNYYKTFAHAGCAIIYFSFVLFMITRECIFYINLRQAYLLSPLYSSRISSKTVLFTSVPERFMDEGILRSMFGEHVVRMWFSSDTKELEDLVGQRDKAAFKLEAAETKLITTAAKNKFKADQKAEKAAKKHSGEHEAAHADETGGSQWIGAKDRPTHKLGKFGLYGKKVDTIDWSRSELTRLIPEVKTRQNAVKATEVKLSNSVFIEFTSLVEAQAAYQSLSHHQALQMAPRYTGILPGEVIWGNLSISWWSRVIRGFVATGVVTALVIFWSIPVAFVGAISNLPNLICLVPAFSFLNALPSAILGVVTGLLPSVLLAVLMAVLPIFLRLMARVKGDPTLSEVELSTQNYYFTFQVVQVFLVATLGSAATSSVQSIVNNPASATTLLATQIPLASNFYYAYFVLQGLGVVAGVLVGLAGLALFYILGKFLDNTPRKMFNRWSNLSGIGWGTLFPIYSNLWVIAICYAVIAPLVLFFAAVGIYLFYFAYRYNFMFVSNANVDTKGLVYPRALMHVFIGLYIAEVCLIGYFAIQTGASLGALGPLILMILMLIFTVLYHISLNSALGPLLAYLPRSLEAEERRIAGASATNGHSQELGEKNATNSNNGLTIGADTLGPAPHTKPNFFTKWLRPDVYTDYETMRRLVPVSIEIRYEPQEERDAYYNPAVSSDVPLLWIPRDQLGMSKTAVTETGKVLPITDEGATVSEQGKIVWDHEGGRPPIYQEKTYY